MHPIALSASCIALMLLAAPASADTERIATACEKGVCFHWWPKLVAPAGWLHDRDQSLHYNFNALAPAGKSFADSDTVMYANAIFRPRVPDSKTLQDFIKADHANFLRESPGLSIAPAGDLKTADDMTALSWSLTPKTGGNWERVAYFEEGEYYMVFVISSRSEAGLREQMPSFERLVTGYKR